MPRLVINPGSSSAREIQLKPGMNRIGRGLANDFTIEDPSISESHCQIRLDDGMVVIKDLGSTNGTFVNRGPVQETALQAGQTIHLGGVEMVFHSDAPARNNFTEQHAAASPAMAPVVLAASGGTIVAVSHTCKFHPKTTGRYRCDKCDLYFCEACMIPRKVEGVPHKFCRRCGAECVAVQVQFQRVVPAGFFARLPGAFCYPFRGTGILLLIVGMIIFGALKFGGLMMGMGSLRFLLFGIILQIFAGGYLFCFLQNIIHSTAAEDDEMPGLPGMSNVVDDIVMPFLRFLGLGLISFGLLIGLELWFLTQHQPPLGLLMTAATIFGCIYFPMSFLVVAMLDSVAAANPLVVVPSILKVPVEYLIILGLLAAIYGFRVLGDVAVNALFPEGATTHSMAQFFLMVATYVFWGFASLYLVTVSVRLLGLLYLTKKEELGWLNR